MNSYLKRKIKKLQKVHNADYVVRGQWIDCCCVIEHEGSKMLYYRSFYNYSICEALEKFNNIVWYVKDGEEEFK